MFVPLNVHSHYSLLDGLCTPDKLVERCAELGYKGMALTDHASVAGSVRFVSACQDANIKPMLGCDIYVADGIAEVSNLFVITVIAKNKAGWDNLIKISSIANNNVLTTKADRVYPIVSWDTLMQHNEGLIGFSGGIGSELFNAIFSMDAYDKEDLEDITKCVSKNALKDTVDKIAGYKSVFVDGFFVQIDLSDINNLPMQALAADVLREAAKQSDVECIACPSVHYANPEDADDHKVLLCSALKETMKRVKATLHNVDDKTIQLFFRSDSFGIPSSLGQYRASEIITTQAIMDMCEDYDILSSPKLPHFSCPNNMTEDEYLRELCRENWGPRILDREQLQKLMIKERIGVDEAKRRYGERVNYELGVISEAGLAGYFLIVQDYVNWAKEQGWLCGPGRGCLHPDTHIYIENGCVKKIKDITVEDKILCKDGVFRGIKFVHKYACDEELISIRTYYDDNDVNGFTSDHKILAEKCCRPDNYENLSEYKKGYIKKVEEPHFTPEFIECEKLDKDDWLVFPIPKTVEKSIDKIDLGEFVTNDSKYSLKTSDSEYCYRTTVNPLTAMVKQIDKHSRYIDVDVDFMKILGIFIGDGWWLTRSNNEIGFCFNPKSKKDRQNIILLKNFCKKYGFRITKPKQQKKTLVQYYIFSWHLNAAFKDMFNSYETKSNTKHIPEFCFALNEELKTALLSGICDSDGHLECKRMKITTVSKMLGYQIKYLLSTLGYPASVHHYDREDIRWKNVQRCYIVSYPTKENNYFRKNDEYIYLKSREISNIVNQDGYVYDISVDSDSENHNYTTSSFVVHNSAGGCMIAYLLGITGIDPIQYDLIFERFYNKGRNTATRVALPDIDVDFPKFEREKVIEYIKDTYGHGRVSNMVTFGTLQGRSAIKLVFRVFDVCSAQEANLIASALPQKADIADAMQASGDHSIIEWVLSYDPKKLEAWCTIQDGEWVGMYADYFKQAARLEGTFNSFGKHASGIVIAYDELDNVCPMIYDKKGGDKIAGMEMNDLEAMGHVKFDILGVAFLSKLMIVNELLKKGFN